MNHKEEQPHRIKADQADLKKLRMKLEKVTHPLKPEQHPSVTKLVDVVTGRIAPDTVNVDMALDIGR